MADRRYEIDDLLVRPGTYFNPQTEVLVVVDDSPSLDTEIFNMEEFEGADWILVSDDTPLDEPLRDEMLERFQVKYHPGAANSIAEDDEDHDADPLEDDEQEVGREDIGPDADDE